MYTYRYASVAAFNSVPLTLRSPALCPRPDLEEEHGTPVTPRLYCVAGRDALHRERDSTRMQRVLPRRIYAELVHRS